LAGREATKIFTVDAEPAAVTIDPNTWLLMEAGAFTKRPSTKRNGLWASPTGFEPMLQATSWAPGTPLHSVVRRPRQRSSQKRELLRALLLIPTETAAERNQPRWPNERRPQ
jgi:hypothetical protein